MQIDETIATALFDLKKKNGWSDEQFLNHVSLLSIQRKELATFFDRCVSDGEMKALDKLTPETLKEIRVFVKSKPLKDAKAQLELGKVCALLIQLKN